MVSQPAPRPRVLYFGTYDRDYSRNRILMDGLRAAGFEVTECHAPLWSGTADKVEAAAGRQGPLRLAGRALRAYARLVRAYWPLRRSYDVMLLGYAGQFDVFPARLLTWLAGRPLALDVFMSVYLIAYERGLPAQGLLRAVEWLALRLPDLLLLDTAEYAAWFERIYGIRRDRFRLVPTGADDAVYRPLPPRAPDGSLRVIYFGGFIPNHGVPVIVEAARLLRDDPAIRFELVGDGPDRPRAQAAAARHGLQNVTFVDWLAQADLAARVAQADVVLGVFGQTPQSLMTVQNKIYAALAMARPVVSGDSPTVRAALAHGESIWLVPRADPAALAQAIRGLHNDPDLRRRLAETGYRLFRERYTSQALGRAAAAHLEPLLRRG